MTTDADDFRRLADKFVRSWHADMAVRMLRLKSFDLRTLSSLSDLIGRPISYLDSREIAHLNGATWDDMGPDLAHMLRLRCLGLLGLEAALIDRIEPTPKRRWWEIWK